MTFDKGECSLGFCSLPAKVKGYCQYHYDRQRLGKSLIPYEPFAPQICRGPACSKRAVARGLCGSHWSQAYGKGRNVGRKLSRLKTEPLTEQEMFDRSIQKDDPSGCWIWKTSGSRKGYDAETGEGGYPQLRVGGTVYQAHRWSYARYRGVILHRDDTLDHLCRNTKCCNPDHLEVVSRVENIQRKHLYEQLRSENRRLREFIREQLGVDPEAVLRPPVMQS